MIPKENSHSPPGQLPKTLLVTGGCGYLGATLIRMIAQDDRFADASIRILDNMERQNYPALFDLNEGPHVEFIEGDILDPTTLRLAVREVDAVVHLAAIVRTPISFDHPAWLEQVNHWGTVRLIEEVLQAGKGRFIYSSSAAVYGPGGPFHESDPCRPIGPYAQSKKNAEQAVVVAADRGLEPTILRLGTLYGLGPGMRFDAVVNRMAYLAGTGQSLSVYGLGRQKRPVIHVRDAAQAILFSLSQPEATIGRILNTASGNATVLDVVETIQQADPQVAVRYTDQDVLTHLSYEVDNTALMDLGFRHEETLKTGIKELLQRFRGVESSIARQIEV